MVRPNAPRPSFKKYYEHVDGYPSTGGPNPSIGDNCRKNTGMFNKVLQAIQDSKMAMEAQLGTIQMETGLLRADHTKLVDRMDDAESTLTKMIPTLASMQDQLKTLQTAVRELKARAKDAEGISQNNIVHFLGFPKESESPSMELFLEDCTESQVSCPTQGSPAPSVSAVAKHS
ncbi:hypothetical protein NDU88_006407 [Pleurodeles waltl]|uniref:Uncharacterized protein n=1 Tax=Pleurodeles waltl TaxID=8319 RepID=A0AAV7TFI5_PLEWA|nr:hypothetical protein NDU88_006407 [Pleurodeles waltl]